MKRLTAQTILVAELDAPQIDAAFALFRDAYDGADRGRFARDLAEKQRIILLRDRDSGELKGF